MSAHSPNHQVQITVGYCKRGPMDDYKYFQRFHLLGVDFTGIDAAGNKYQLNVRDGGYRFEINDKVKSMSEPQVEE